MFTKAFWKAAAERAIKTFAQALGALLVADGADLIGTDWVASLSVAGMAAVVSVLTSVASNQVSDNGPSLANEVVEPKPILGKASLPADDDPKPILGKA